ncbi:acetyl-CoA carboxylase biotin carboxylase subunit family protein [Enterococcus faecalis]
MDVFLIFEDQELKVTDELLKSMKQHFILLRCQQYKSFSDKFSYSKYENVDVLEIDIFIPAKLTAEYILKYCKSKNFNIIRGLNLSEKCQYIAQDVFRELKINFLSYEVTLIGKDKIYMKDFFKKNGIRTVEYKEVFTIQEIKEILKDWKYKGILKPRNSDSCREIISIDNQKTLNALKDMDLSKGWILEKKINFSNMKEYAVDISVIKKNIQTLFITEYPSPLLETVSDLKINGNISVNILELEFRDELVSSIKRFIKNLDMSEGLLHLEFFFSKGKIYFSEVGFRLGGGDIVYNHERAFKVEYHNILKNILLIESYSFFYNTYSCASELLLPIIKEGKITNIEGIEKIRRIPNVEKIEIYFNTNDTIKRNITSFECFGKVFLRTKNTFEAKKYMKEILRVFNYNVLEELDV